MHSIHSMPTCRPVTGSFYRACLRSLNPRDYGWTIGVHGYEPVPTLDPTAPEQLLKITSCNYHGDLQQPAMQLHEEWDHVHLALWSL